MANALLWEYKDTLRVMTEKFNAAVGILNDLQNSTGEVNDQTIQALTDLQNDFNTEINSIREELSTKVSNITAEDLNLDQVDNTSDMNKPVSTATRQAIDEAVADMLTAEEAGLEIDGQNLPDPEVSAPIRQYIEDRLTELFIAYNNGTYTPEYGVATSERLGVVKASNRVTVNETTGYMDVPEIDTIQSDVSVLSSRLNTTITALESNNTATSKLVQDVGNVTGLATVNKNSLVAAINELVQKVNDLDS